MPDSIYDEPAPEGYEQRGWRCAYHPPRSCHNPSDCDLVPQWVRKPEERVRRYWRRWVDLSEEEREDAKARS